MTIAYGTGANQLTPNLALASMITAELHLLLADTQNLRNSIFIDYAGSVNGLGTPVIKYRKVGLGGRDIFQDATTEISSHTAATALTNSSVDITVARKYLNREISDLATMISYGDPIDPFVLAEDMALSYEAKFADMTAAACANFTTTKGSSANTFSVDLMFEGIFALEQADSDRGAPPPYAAVLHPKALAEFQDSLRNEVSNVIAMSPASLEMVKAKGQGYVGDILGVSVYRSSFVNAGGGAKKNWMMATKALAYADGAPQIVGASQVIELPDAKCVVEMDRKSQSATSLIVGHCYLGLSVVQDERGVLLESKA